MPLQITIPSPGESITEVTLGTWHKSDGDWVDKDEPLLEIESDKATLELPAPSSGVLSIEVQTGVEVDVGATVGQIDDKASPPGSNGGTKPAKNGRKKTPKSTTKTATGPDHQRATPVARKLAAEKGIDLSTIAGSGPSGRIMKSDVLNAGAPQQAETTPAPASTVPAAAAAPAKSPKFEQPTFTGDRSTRRERMTKLRQRVAERLVMSQQTAAMLTTFNEVDMTNVMALRSKHKDAFMSTHGVKLGFMSFFAKAAISALKSFPRVNAFIIGDEIEYHDYIDLAVAVGTDKGLVVPVIRNAETRSMAGIEAGLVDLSTRAREGTLTVDEMTGGTFTLSNGGVYGSLMSTPILNPPQSGILGMHKIMTRAVEDPSEPGKIALRPMMYLALSYDHRIIDGAEAVGFLVHVKQCIEQPERMLLDI
ncbi:MAG: dihydrolipoyllysine-residue succinyltransferase [Phycisphaerae bacterium]|nr:dihydrolipoyllysine-residue succinyltransferase [Phycisphaerae bacterium]